MTTLAYARVSKSDGSQSLDLQRDALIASGVDPDHIYEDQASGKKDDRPGLEACLKALRKGDILVVWKLDRLGRSTKHLITIVEDLKVRGVEFKTLTGFQIDTTGSMGKLVFTIFAGIAEFERELIRERTIEGLKAARKRGRKGGRKHKITRAKLNVLQANMGKPGTVVEDLAKDLGISPATIYQYVAPTGELREKGIALMNKKAA